MQQHQPERRDYRNACRDEACKRRTAGYSLLRIEREPYTHVERFALCTNITQLRLKWSPGLSTTMLHQAIAGGQVDRCHMNRPK